MSVVYAKQFATGISQSSGSVNTSTSQTFPGQTLIVACIVNNNASFSGAPEPVPTMGGTAGLTWIPVWTDNQGGGSPTMRQSCFVALSPTPVTGTVTATWSVNQNTVLSLLWVGGIDGTSAAAAYALAVQANTAGVAQGSYSLTIPGLTAGKDGLVSAFSVFSGSAATHRIGWTELADTTSTSGGRLDVQFLAGLDTAASCSLPFGSAAWVAGVVRCIAPPSPAPVAAYRIIQDGAPAGNIPFSFYATKGRCYLFMAAGAGTELTASAPVSSGFTWNNHYVGLDGAGARTIVAGGVAASSGPVSAVMPYSAAGGQAAAILVEVDCDSVTYPNGYRQIKALNLGVSATLKTWTFDSAFNDVNSTVIMMVYNGLATPELDGWLKETPVPTVNGVHVPVCIRRHNSFQPEYNGNGSYGLALALEFVGPLPPTPPEPCICPDLTVPPIVSFPQDASPDPNYDLQTDPVSGRWVFDEGDLTFTRGGNAIRQSLQLRIGFFLAEWFLDETKGLPWFTQILGVKNPNLAAIRAIFRTVIIETPGVNDILFLDVTFDKVLRKLSLSFRVDTDLGELTLTFTSEVP